MSEAKKLEPSLKRNLLILGGTLGVLGLLVVLMLVMRGKSETTQAGSADLQAMRSIAPGNTGTQGEQAEMGHATKEKIREAQLREAEEARKQGKPYLPRDQVGKTEAVDPHDAQGAGYSTAEQYRPNYAGGAGAGVRTEEELRREQARAEGLKVQLQALMGQPTKSEAPKRIAEASASTGGAGAGVAQASLSQLPGTSAAGSQGQQCALVADALEIYAAETASPVDTYRTTYVSAEIRSGKLAGAFLTGKSQVMEEGLQITFTGMRWNRQSYKIEAISLDEKTATDAMASNVDRRYLQRYAMPVLFAAAGGYYTAKSQTGSEVVVSNGGIGVSTPPPTKQQAIAAGVSAAMTIGRTAIEREAQRPEQHTLPARTPIGVMFNSRVCSSDEANQAPMVQRVAPVANSSLAPAGAMPQPSPMPMQQAPALNNYSQR